MAEGDSMSGICVYFIAMCALFGLVVTISIAVAVGGLFLDVSVALGARFTGWVSRGSR